jgi:hypothetical protein
VRERSNLANDNIVTCTVARNAVNKQTNMKYEKRTVPTSKELKTTNSNFFAEPKQAAVASYARETSDTGVIHPAIDVLETSQEPGSKINMVPREGETESNWLHQTLLDKY